MKNAKQQILLLLSLGASSLPLLGEGSPSAVKYEEMRGLVKAGRTQEAFQMMTKKARREHIGESLGFVFEAVVADEKLENVFTLSDGLEVKAQISDLGLDTFEIPEWMNGDGYPSKQERKAYFDSLMGLYDQAGDKGMFLRSLDLLSMSIEPGYFRGTVSKVPEGIADKPGTVWVLVGEEDLVAFRFREKNGSLKYAGFDWDSMDEQSRLFVKRENIALKGETVDGKVIQLSDYKGKVVLIDFWGTW